jgi:tRNA modification GTPase
LRSRAIEGDLPAGTAARCGESLARAGRSLRAAAETLRLGGGDELVAVDLRQGLDDLGRVVGAVVTDDLLDRIFRRFCIGK